MKKVITLSLLLIFVLAGCVGQKSDNQNKNDVMSKRQRMPDFERPEEDPGLSGIVKTVVGNEITVLKIERTERSEEAGNDNAKNANNEDVEKQRPTAKFSGGSGMFMGGGGRDGGKMGGGSGDNSDRIAMLKSLSAGEEKVTVPVGIKMLKNNNGEMVEATLADISVDKMIIVWTDKEITDKNVANFMIIN